MRLEAEPRASGGGRPPAPTDLAAIASLDRQECMTLWLRQFGHVPPKHVSAQFMRKALAYEAQVQQFGGHSNVVRKALKAVLKQASSGRSLAIRGRGPAPLRPGIHLVREWNGRSYQVEVLDEGFRMDGKTYRSLTAIARKITGAHWSGPRFFGVG